MVEDRETGERLVFNEIPYFQDFLIKWRPERQKQIELEKVAAARRRARNIRMGIFAGIIAGILAVAGGFVYIIYGPKPSIDTGRRIRWTGRRGSRCWIRRLRMTPSG